MLRITSVVAIGILMCAVQAATAETITQSVFVPHSPSAAGRDYPACATSVNQRTLAQDLVALAGVGIGAYIGSPAPGAIANNPQFNNWVTARMGLHDGPSICAPMCFVVPASARVTGTVHVASERYPWGPGPLPVGQYEANPLHNWSAIPGPSTEVIGATKVLCWTAMNWSDNLARRFTITLNY